MPDDQDRTTATPATRVQAETPDTEAKAGQEQAGLSDDLASHWDDILGPRPETIEQRLIRELGLPHPGTFTLASSNGRKIVSIDPNGKVTYGEGYTPDAAAEEFWTSMALKRRGMEERLQHLAIMETMLVRMGRADLGHERAQLAAVGGGGNEQAIAERARMNLTSIVHQVMDLARGLARRPPNPTTATTTVQIPAGGVSGAREGRGDPGCALCHGEGRVLGDCGDSPNVWFDPCPTCRPDPNCPTCRGNGRINGGPTGMENDPMESWTEPCPTCRPQTPVDRGATQT